MAPRRRQDSTVSLMLWSTAAGVSLKRQPPRNDACAQESWLGLITRRRRIGDVVDFGQITVRRLWARLR